jgi:hypothetical protein
MGRQYNTLGHPWEIGYRSNDKNVSKASNYQALYRP